MGYEARQDAMNDYIADRIAEATPDESEYTMDEDIPEVIAEGIYDIAVLLRTVEILKERGMARRHIEEIVEELKEQ